MCSPINLDRFQGAAPDDDRDDTFHCVCCDMDLPIDYLADWIYQPDSEGICVDCIEDWREENEEEDDE